MPVLVITNETPFYTNQMILTEDAGFDLFVPENTTILRGERKMVSMGVKAMVLENDEPQHYWLVPRSSISKTGLMMLNSIGVIDRSYRGELIAALWNTTNDDVVIEKGQRLVQIVTRDMTSITECRVVDSLPETSRGAGGFGSTGI